MIRIEYLEKILEYNPALGQLKWKRDTAHLLRGQTARKGKIAGKCGQVSINGQSYATHIIAWMLFYGKRPVSVIRFIDGNKENFRIDNMVDTGSREDRMCTKCGVRGGADLFYNEPRLKAGLTTQCRECMDKQSSKPRLNHKKLKKIKPSIENPVFLPPIVLRSREQTKPRFRS